MQLHPLGKFSDDFVREFGKEVISRIGVGITEIEGKVFEQVLCEIFSVKWKGSNNGLTDVLVQGVGYSVKSKLWDSRSYFEKDGTLRRVGIIIGRCSPDTHDGSHVEKNVTPPDEAGRKVVGIYNHRLAEAKKFCDEFRQINILKSKCLRNWLMYEFSPDFFNSADFSWKWERSRGKKTFNLYGTNDESRLTWQPNGSQLTLNTQIPKIHKMFSLPKSITKITKSDVLSNIGYEDNWVKVS